MRFIPAFYILSQSKESQAKRTWPFCWCPLPLAAAGWAAAAAAAASGRLKRGGGDPSEALWGHLWNRLTNVSLLCHKDKRLTKLPINVPFTTHLFVTQVFIPAVSGTVLGRLTRPWAIPRTSSKEGSGWGTVPGRILLNFDGAALVARPLTHKHTHTHARTRSHAPSN